MGLPPKVKFCPTVVRVGADKEVKLTASRHDSDARICTIPSRLIEPEARDPTITFPGKVEQTAKATASACEVIVLVAAEQDTRASHSREVSLIFVRHARSHRVQTPQESGRCTNCSKASSTFEY